MSNQHHETFIFDGKAKMLTIGLMVVGAICLALSYTSDAPEMGHMRFWTNFLHNSVFFTGVAFAAVIFISTHALAWGGWSAVLKRVPEAIMIFLFVGIILFLFLAIAVMMGAEGTELLYLWNNQEYLNPDPANEDFDALAFHKSAFVNPTSYLLTVGVVAVWAFFAYKFRSISLKEDKTPYVVTKDKSVPENVRKNRIYAAAFLPIAGFSSAYVIWLWVMSVDTHWYSTLFAWYCATSMWVSMCAVMFMIITYLRSKGLMQKFTDEHMHDIGKYIFAFSVFWAYLWFSQFMLIWYSNNGEETQYYFIRLEQFPVLFYGNLLINFVAPFFVLMMNSSKRTIGTLGFMAGLVFFGHWLDFFLMIKPGVWYNYEHKMHTLHAAQNPDTHGENTYHLNQNDMPKPVLTTYQDDANQPETDSISTDTTQTPVTEEHGHEGHDHTAGDHSHDGHDHDDHEGHDHAAPHHPSFLMGVHFPGFLDLGCFAGFLGLFLFVTFSILSRSSLYPPNDPYIKESETYDTGIGPERDAH